MKIKSQYEKYFTLLLLFAFNLITGQDLKTLNLTNKLSILNDRAFFLFPDSAKNMARPVDIMSADHNANLETRIVYNRDKKRLVFFAREIFLLGEKKDFEDTKNQKLGGIEFKKKILVDSDSLVCLLSTPFSFDSVKNAVLISSMMVITQDRSIFRIDAYINPEAYSEKDEYINLAEKIFKTISKGTRYNPRKARTEKIDLFCSKKKFEFALPENYYITIDQKYDFQVLKVHKYLNYTDSCWMGLTIYFGNHPSFFYPQYGFEKYIELQKSEFLDEKVEWYFFANETEKLYLKEQKIPSDKIEKGIIVHIAISANNKEAIEELTGIVGKIKLKK
ncbi:MAG TPA: hypothetical protein VNZ49_05275 [Bacteroidia bacterium]|nr:hypothetical protein [Bacteroidia bacterium]